MSGENVSVRTREDVASSKLDSIPIKAARFSNPRLMHKLQLQKSSMTIQRSMHSGPLPSPDVLREYDDIYPGLANRIVCMAEEQSAHRREIEKIAVKSGSRDSLLGLIFGFLIGIATIFVGYLLGINGNVVSSSVIGTGGVAGLVAVFIYGTRSRRKEREDKSK